MASRSEFKDKVVVVTGATQGIGEATARLVADRGASGVVLTGRSLERAESVRASLGCPAVAFAADLSDVEECRDIVDFAESTYGRVDVLMNCAGTTDRGRIESTTRELWDYVFAVNVRAPFFLMQRVVEIMRRQHIGGTIVNAISMASYMGNPNLLPYAASKAALVNLTRTAAYALLGDRIRVNGLNLGWTDTPGEHATQRRWHGASDGSWLERAEGEQPFGRLLNVKEVARALVFLASPESGIMTGSVVDFDQTILCSGSLSDVGISRQDTGS